MFFTKENSRYESDELTGPPALRLTEDKVLRAIQSAKPYSHKIALMSIDLDGFKSANDNLGHEAGVFVLRAVAARLTREIRAEDAAGRIGGDEFMVVLTNLSGLEKITEKRATEVASRIIASISIIYYVVAPYSLTQQWRQRIRSRTAGSDQRLQRFNKCRKVCDIGIGQRRRHGEHHGALRATCHVALVGAQRVSHKRCIASIQLWADTAFTASAVAGRTGNEQSLAQIGRAGGAGGFERGTGLLDYGAILCQISGVAFADAVIDLRTILNLQS